MPVQITLDETATLTDIDQACHDLLGDIQQLPQPVLVIGHLRPDGDAIGSIQAMRMLLEALGHDAIGYAPDVPPHLAFGATGIVDKLPKFASVVAVDAASTGERLPLTDAQLAAAVSVNIDHHATNTFVADSKLVYERASSACELIHDLRRVSNVAMTDAQEQAFAEAVFLGLRTDTGSFSFALTTEHTFRVAAACADAGADINRISQELGKRRKAEVDLLAAAMNNLTWLAPDDRDLPQLAVVRLAYDQQPAGDINMQPILSMLRSVEGVKISTAFTQTEDGSWRVSLRSNGLDVASIAERFGGGGHKPAAGARAQDLAQVDEIIAACAQACQGE